VLREIGGAWCEHRSPSFSVISRTCQYPCFLGVSAGLFFALPATLLGHMVGLGPGVKSILLWAIVALFSLFAAGKWRQPVAEDIGDKSVFWFNSLGDEEQEQWIERLKTSDPSNPPAID